MRFFIAVDFDGRDYFNEIQQQLPKGMARCTFPKIFHLTLKFIGEVGENRIAEIKAILSSIRLSPFRVKTEKIGVFPSETSNIRVIWLGFKDSRSIIELQKKIDSSLEGLFPADTKFHPHITLARVKFVAEKEAFLKKVKSIKVEPREFEIKGFKLIKSDLGREGPAYTDIAVF